MPRYNRNFCANEDPKAPEHTWSECYQCGRHYSWSWDNDGCPVCEHGYSEEAADAIENCEPTCGECGEVPVIHPEISLCLDCAIKMKPVYRRMYVSSRFVIMRHIHTREELDDALEIVIQSMRKPQIKIEVD